MAKTASKDLGSPSPFPIWWVATTKKGKVGRVYTKFWYDAREEACKLLHVDRDGLESVSPEVPISLMDFMLAPAFTIFTGPALDCGIGDGWDVFGIDGGAVPDKEVEREAIRRGIVVAFNGDGMWCTPEWDSDALEADHPAACDECAALAYLNAGGRLVKLPDHMGSKYYRLYPVLHIQKVTNDRSDGCER